MYGGYRLFYFKFNASFCQTGIALSNGMSGIILQILLSALTKWLIVKK